MERPILRMPATIPGAIVMASAIFAGAIIISTILSTPFYHLASADNHGWRKWRINSFTGSISECISKFDSVSQTRQVFCN